MSMVINHNIPALTTYDTVNSISSSLEKSIKKLSTGLRINSAADDAAGLAISEKMRAQVNGLDQAVKNTQDGISLIQTAEGALSQTHSILQRMRELSVQAANDTLTAQDRSYIQQEIDQLVEEIDHIGNTTTFNTKNLLNGDAGAVWSSSDASTKAIINGGLRVVDQFGQKSSAEGNYKISVTAEAGQGQVQKTDIFRVKHQTVGVEGTGEYVTGVSASNLKANYKADDTSTNLKYTVSATAAQAGTTSVAVLDGSTNAAKTAFKEKVDLSELKEDAVKGKNLELNFDALSYVESTKSVAGVATFRVSGWATDTTGNSTWVEDTVTMNIAKGSKLASVTVTKGVFNGLKVTGLAMDKTGTSGVKVGDKVIIGDDKTQTGNADKTGDVEVKAAAINSTNSAADTHKYMLNAASLTGKNVTLRHLYLDSSNSLQTGNISLSFAAQGSTGGELQVKDLTGGDDTDGSTGALASFEYFEIGDVASDKVALYDLEKFWDSQGNFMLTDPQNLTITQGDGKKTSVTFYQYDTLGDVKDKLNDAIANKLNQAQYLSNSEDASKFVSYVYANGSAGNLTSSTAGNMVNSGQQTVKGTFIVRSIVPGSEGKLNIASSNEAFLNAFSLNTIQEAKQSNYYVTIQDAHTGDIVNGIQGEKITGNVLYGRLHENVDVEFDSMSGISAKFVDDSAGFSITGSTNATETYLHLSDNTLVLQIGANEGDDMAVNIGDMRSHALGVDKVIVTDRESAGRAITIIDNAIDKVSTQRAKLGAYQNRLEYTASNLTTSSENLSAAESRIRDTDMASEMMNFTKLQIMNQAGISMLAQANQLPQNVLSLIR